MREKEERDPCTCLSTDATRMFVASFSYHSRNKIFM